MMNGNSQNYFGITNAADRKCHVKIWTSSHPVLIVGAKNPIDKTIAWLLFSTPLYVEGPNVWQGANFCIASGDELMSYWKNIWKNRISQEKFAHYTLFKAQIKNAEAYFKVIAPDARLMNQVEIASMNT